MTRPNEDDLEIMDEHTSHLSCESVEGMAYEMGVSMVTARKYLRSAGYIYDHARWGYIDTNDEYQEAVVGWRKREEDDDE